MATTFTLGVAPFFADGITLYAYPFTSDDPSGRAAPVPAASSGVVATGGKVTFASLAYGTHYFVGTGAAPYNYISITTAAPVTSGGGGGGVPAGGSAGQLLRKFSDVDLDTDWISPATLSGTNPAALGGVAAPGATGQAADAGHIHDTSTLARATDLQGLTPIHWFAGNWYNTWVAGTVSGGGANQFSDHPVTQFWMPFLVPDTHTVDCLAVRVDAAGSTGSLLRLALFTDSGGHPGTLIVDAGTVDGTTTGMKTTTVLTTPATIPRGVVWGAVVSQGTPATTPGVTYAQPGTSALNGALFSGTTGSAPVFPSGAGFQSQGGASTGPLATDFATGFSSVGIAGKLPLIWLRVAS